jgi:hypothetical protein
VRDGYDAEWHHFLVTVSQVGSDITLKIFYDGELLDSTTQSTSGSNIGYPVTALPNYMQSLASLTAAYGYVAVYDRADIDAASRYGAMLAWVAEQAHERIIRECGYSGVPIACTAGSSTVLGPQPVGTLLDVLRDAERADMGVLYEVGWGLGYQPLRDRFDAPVALALDFDEGHVDGEPEPADDDSHLVNRWKVSRDGGSSSTQEDNFSPLGTQAGGPGVYADAITVNVEADDHLPHHARWRVHRDTLDEDRWPKIDLNFATLGGRTLIPVWTMLGYGARITLDNPPPQVSQAQINLVIEGRRQHFNSLEWTASINASPAATYQVARYGPSPVPSRYDTRGSSLALAVDDVEATWMVAIEGVYPRWVTSSAYPDRFAPFADLRLLVGGLVRSCTSIASSREDTFTRPAEVDGWGQLTSGQSWVIGDGTAAAFTTSGTAGGIAVAAVNDEHHIAVDVGYARVQTARASVTLGVVPTGAAINWGLALRRENASNLYWIDVQVSTSSTLTLRIISKVSGVNALLTTQAVSLAHSTTVPRILVASIDCDNMIRVKIYDAAGSEPAVWDLEYQGADDVLTTGTSVGVITRLMSGNTNALPVALVVDNFAVTNPQVFEVTRLTPDKTVLAGTSVRVYQPPIYGL